MSTLLMRFIAPLQSWGVQSNFSTRDSGLEPSKSGVIGLICAALGRPRTAPLEDLATLRMGVRVDREGTLKRDYHIAQKIMISNGKGNKGSIVSDRYYLADAAFLVGLEGEPDILTSIHAALQHPVWALFLGRKAFPPAAPIWLTDGFQINMDLVDALTQFGWIYPWKPEEAPAKVRLVLEDDQGEQARTDVPLSFEERRFSSRRVTTRIVDSPAALAEEVF